MGLCKMYKTATNAAVAMGNVNKIYCLVPVQKMYYTGPSIVLFFTFQRFSVGIRSRDYANKYRALIWLDSRVLYSLPHSSLAP